MERLFGVSSTGFRSEFPCVFPSRGRDAAISFAPEVHDMMRMNRAVLAAFLCAAVAPATCDPFDRGSPFQGAQWPTLSEADPTFQRALAVSSTTRTEREAPLALVEPPDVDKRPLYTASEANALPSTSTSAPPSAELQSRLLIACLGFVLAVAGGVMLLLPRK